MKYLHAHACFFMFILCSSCSERKNTEPIQDKTSPGANKQITSPGSDQPNLYNTKLYIDTEGKHLLIQNSFPKGGVPYTDPGGNVYGYAVFWSRIINETNAPLELNIDFPATAYKLSNVPGKYFKVLVPPDTMTTGKIPLFYYGLTNAASFLDKHLNQPSSFTRTIPPKDSSGIYFIMLIMTREATGMARTALELKGQDLVYKISRYSSTKPITLIEEKEIRCGSINLKNLVLKE